jgi:F-type H+-transporting ATPase subunit b
MLNHITVFAAEVGAENGFWLSYDLEKVFWSSMACIVVGGLLWKFARKPIADMLRGRISSVTEELDEAAQLRLVAEAERDRIKAALADSDSEAERIIAEARASAAQLAVDIDARIEADVAAIRERAAADLVSTRTQAESDLSGELSRLSLGAAEKVVESSLDDATQQRLIDDYINQVGSQN